MTAPANAAESSDRAQNANFILVTTILALSLFQRGMSLNGALGSIMHGMVIRMNHEQLQTLAQLRAVVDGSAAMSLAVSAEERYGFITRTVCRFHFANRAPCLIGMEACGGSQHWTRELQKLGHQVKLLSARRVEPFVGGNKNDAPDARANLRASSAALR